MAWRRFPSVDVPDTSDFVDDQDPEFCDIRVEPNESIRPVSDLRISTNPVTVMSTLTQMWEVEYGCTMGLQVK